MALFVSFKALGTMITPTMLELSDTAMMGEFILENTNAEEKLFQASIKQWSQKDGDIFTATDEVLVLPLMASIPPHRKQKFRVILRKTPPAQTQNTYRLFFTETKQRTMLNKTGLSFLVTISVPVYANGKDLSTSFTTDWSLRKQTKGKGLLTLKNSGQRTFVINKLSLVGKSEFSDDAMHYLLPGSKFSWPVSLNHNKSDDVKATYTISGMSQVTDFKVQKSTAKEQ